MNTNLTAEQSMLQEMLQRFFRDLKPRSRLPDEITDEDDAKLWQGLTDLGVTAILAPDQAEAFGGGVDEAMLVLRELGRAGIASPFLPHSVLAVTALRGSASPQAAAWIDRIETGDAALTVAFDDARSRYDWHRPHTMAREEGGRFYLEGAKTGVRYASTSAAVVASARFANGELGLFLLTPAAFKLEGERRSLDGAATSELTWRVDQPADAMLARGGQAEALVEHLRGWNVAALCATAVGAMQGACELTGRYLGERRQFGQRLSQFQVLRHRFVDMRIQLLKAESMATLAAAWVLEEDSTQRRSVIAASKIVVDTAARFVGQQAIHLHGAIGMTAEYELGALARQLTAVALQGGDVDFHTAALV